MLTFRVTGGKKQSEERAALFAVRVDAIVRHYLSRHLVDSTASDAKTSYANQLENHISVMR